MRSLALAYPDQIRQVTYRKGDWAVLLRDTWYYYAGGKLLPEDRLKHAAAYSSQPFYIYSGKMPVWRPPDAAMNARMEEYDARRKIKSVKRASDFYDDLYQASTKAEAYSKLKTTLFLGHKVLVHYSILEELALVESGIRKAARSDSSVQKWIKGIASVTAWNWRDIASTEARSYHAYGTAIDILPRSTGGKQTYWLWTAQHIKKWWTVPYSRRYAPPAAVIKAFESYGFVWGGKWTNYDTMHFEYRPEILIYSGLPIKTY
jgi:hypothetical protein